jgi:hypothetical protein
MKLYENVVIGNFLFSLGFAISAKSKTNTILTSINLLQQTPADKLLAGGTGNWLPVLRSNKRNNSAKSIFLNDICGENYSIVKTMPTL